MPNTREKLYPEQAAPPKVTRATAIKALAAGSFFRVAIIGATVGLADLLRKEAVTTEVSPAGPAIQRPVPSSTTAEHSSAATPTVPSTSASPNVKLQRQMDAEELSSEASRLSQEIKKGAIQSGNGGALPQGQGVPSYLSEQSEVLKIIVTAQNCASALDVPWRFIFSLWAEETGYFTSPLAVQNSDFGGLKGPVNGWSDFNSIESFGAYFIKLLSEPSYSGARNTSNFDAWILGLMNAHYDTSDTYSVYLAKVGGVMGFLFVDANQQQN
jgi:hypothetical protein